MTDISTDDVKRVAALSGLSLNNEEIAAYQQEFAAMLDYFERLNLDSVDTSGVEPTYQVTGLTSVMREDAIINYGVSQSALLKNAPATQESHIKVKRVIK